MQRKWFAVTAAKEGAHLYIYDAIGKVFDGVPADRFVEALDALPPSVKTIYLHVNSPGGDVFEAIAIANALARHPAKVETTIEGLAASAATIVTSGGSDVIKIADNALVMVHYPWSLTQGSAADMRKEADLLDSVTDTIVTTYARHSKLSPAEILALMSAETWMNADEAIANGFADEKIIPVPVTRPGDALTKEIACFHPVAARALRAPERYRDRIAAYVRRPEAPPSPSADAAPFADVMALCRDSGLDLDFTDKLIAANLPLAQVQARVFDEVAKRQRARDNEKALRAMCKIAKVPQLADTLVAMAVQEGPARLHLAQVTALIDMAGGHIDSILVPEAPSAATSKGAKLNLTEIYAERNGVGKKD